MTKNELKALINKKVQRQGTQGAISLAPILNEIIDLIPELTGGGSGVPVVEIELPRPGNIEDVISPSGIDFQISAEKAAILDKNPCAIIASKTANSYIYFLPWKNDEWYRVMYDESTYGAVTSNIQILQRHEKNMYMSILLKAMEVVGFVSNENPSFPLTGFYVPTTKAVYDEINKTK